MSSSSAAIEEGGGSGLARLGAGHLADPANSSLRDIEILVGRMVANAQRDADELRAQARQDAAEILDNARCEADRILDEARSHAEHDRRLRHADTEAADATAPAPIDRETISALVAYLDDAGAIQRRITATVRAAIEAALAPPEP